MVYDDFSLIIANRQRYTYTHGVHFQPQMPTLILIFLHFHYRLKTTVYFPLFTLQSSDKVHTVFADVVVAFGSCLLPCLWLNVFIIHINDTKYRGVRERDRGSVREKEKLQERGRSGRGAKQETRKSIKIHGTILISTLRVFLLPNRPTYSLCLIFLTYSDGIRYSALKTCELIWPLN